MRQTSECAKDFLRLLNFKLLNPEPIPQDIDFVKEVLILFEDVFELSARVQDRRVISARENIADALVGVVHPIFQKIHGNLPGNHVLFFSIFTDEELRIEPEMRGNGVHEFFVSADPGTCGAMPSGQIVGDRELFQAYGDIFDRGRCMVQLVLGDELIEDALELADIFSGIVRDKFGDFLCEDELLGASLFL